jgi:AcrR family transcriptional regulator
MARTINHIDIAPFERNTVFCNEHAVCSFSSVKGEPPQGKNQEHASVRYRTSRLNCLKSGYHMKQEKHDRRSQRTRQLIRSALLNLLFERGYDEITVQDILDRANIGRSTFYTHYFDKEDVLASIADEQLELLRQHLTEREGEQRIIPSLELFQHVQQNQQYFRAMLHGRARDALWDAAQSALSRTVEHVLATSVAEQQASIVPLSVASQYLAGAFLNLLKWWLEADIPYSPEQMDGMFQHLALPGVWATFGGKIAASRPW